MAVLFEADNYESIHFEQSRGNWRFESSKKKMGMPRKNSFYFGYETIHLDLQIWPQKMLKYEVISSAIC